ncbi:outer membrane beta-barrel protein [Winogradskyella sp.]
MKKLVITSMFCLCVMFFSQAQHGSGFGIKGGLNYGGTGDYFSSISDNYQSPDRNLGYHVGIFGKIGDQIYFKPELVYTQLKSDYNSGDFELTKLDAPLLVGLKVLGPVSVFGGPSLQYILDTGFEGLSVNEVEDDFSVGLNFGIALNLGKLGLDLRYERGFNNNEATLFDNNNINVNDRLDTRPEQLILSLSVKL